MIYVSTSTLAQLRRGEVVTCEQLDRARRIHRGGIYPVRLAVGRQVECAAAVRGLVRVGERVSVELRLSGARPPKSRRYSPRHRTDWR